MRAPSVALGAAGKRCRGNARREQQGSVFRANEAAERFPAAWAYVWLLAARTLAATRSERPALNLGNVEPANLTETTAF